MKDNSNNIAATNGSGNDSLPLYDFFIALKQNNFSVSPKQIIDCNSIIDKYAGQVKSEQELCAYLSSVIANSQEEQIQFKEIFEAFYKEKLVAPPPPPQTWYERLIKHLALYRWKYLLLITLLLSAAVLLYILLNKVPGKPIVSVILSQPDSAATGRTDATLVTNDKLHRFALQPQYDWGDGTAADTLSYHYYKTNGNYIITATLQELYKNKVAYIDTFRLNNPVCLHPPSVKIIKSFTSDTIYVGDEITMSAETTGNSKSISWMTSGAGDNKNGEGKSFTVSFNSGGNHSVYCNLAVDDSSCNAEDEINIYIKDTAAKPLVSFIAAPDAADINPLYKVKKPWYYTAAILAFLSLFLTNFFTKRWRQFSNKSGPVDNAAKEEYKKTINTFLGKGGVQQLVFGGKNYLPLPEKEISDVARMMRKRISDDVLCLDIPKTISEAVENAGFFNPAYSTRTQQCEYLVLVDEINNNSQQVKLFEYLLELLVKQGVFIEKFYYRSQPNACYNAAMPNGISLEKLSEKFPRHVLLIMGNAYQLIYPSYPIINSDYLKLLQRWQYKAILTPISFTDWCNKESKVLIEELPIVPVDIIGQILLMQKLFFEEVNILATLYQHNRDFYEAESLDFEDTDELYEYCENAEWAKVPGNGKYENILFQWIAALATYPKVNWEMTLAVGKAILDKYGKTSELNFTNLLRIARIKWMREGRFPDYTRLELLKKLSKENEITARETILVLLNEIPATEIHSDHFSYEEKEVQRVINEFTLYAYDPVKYAGYKRSKDVFGQLNDNGQITDQPAKKYFENDNLDWDTLINAPVKKAGEDVDRNTSLDNYFSVGAGLWKKIYLWSAAISAVVFTISLIGLIALLAIAITGTNRFPSIANKEIFTKDIQFDFTSPVGPVDIADTTISIDGAEIKISGTGIYNIPVTINDSAKDISLLFNGISVFDTMMPIDKDKYDITLTDGSKNPQPAINSITATFMLTKDCMDRLSEYENIIRLVDTSIKVKSVEVFDSIGNKNCFSQYRYGKNVDAKKAEAIANQFVKAGMYVTFNGQVGPSMADNEIVFYNNTYIQEAPPAPVVYVQVSDNSLMTSANNFKNELAKNGFDVKAVSIQNYNYNSEISYYDASMQKAANEIKKYYNKYYPAMNVQARLRAIANLDKNKNLIAVWIKKLDPIPTAGERKYKIQNAKVPPTVKQGEDIGVAFEITSSGLVNTANASPQQISAGNASGTICISSALNCVNFNFNKNSNRSSITKQLTTKGLKPGTYQVTASVKELNLSQQLGSFTVSGLATPPRNGCDTVYSSVDRVSRNYENLDLSAKGIHLKVTAVQNVFGSFTIKKGDCMEQKVVISEGKQQSVKLCDGSVFYFTIKGKNFTAIICNSREPVKN